MAASYLKKAFDPVLMRRIALETYRVMREVEAEVVVVRGLSGIVVATAMAALFNTPFAVVRKDKESSHSTNGFEVNTDRSDFSDRIYDDWMIVDDLIATGATLRAIAESIKESLTIEGRCKGIALYANGDSSTSERKFWKINGYDAPIFDVGKGIDG